MQYHYFNEHNPGVWKSHPAEVLQSRMDHESIAFYTVLSVDQKVKRGEYTTDEAKYQGPFYIDIDSKENIGKSIKAANKTLDKLLALGVKEEAIQIFATGKKGFHFLIPMRFFTKDQPLRKLPLAYRKLAWSLKLPEKETDWEVYSLGRGRMWRIANKKRADNGAFKVQITAAELRAITPDSYAQLCSVERPLLPPLEDAITFPRLKGMFDRCYEEAATAIKPATVYVDPFIVKGLNGELPPCGQDMLAGENLDEDQGYNARSTQFGKLVATFGQQQGPEKLIDIFVHNVEGEGYNTPEKRKIHTMKAFHIAEGNGDYPWSCRSMLSILEDKDSPCLRCPVSFLLNQQDDAIAEAEEEQERQRELRAESKRKRTEPKPQLEKLGAAMVQVRANGHIHSAGEDHQPGLRTNGAENYFRDTEAVNGSDAPKLNGHSDAGIDVGFSDIGTIGEVARPATESDMEIEDLAEAAAELAAPAAAGGGDSDDPPNDPPETGNDGSGDVGPNDFGLDNGGGEGYQFEGRQVTSFVFRWTSVIIEHVDNVRQDRRVALTADLMRGSKKIGHILLDESAWASRANLIAHLSGVGNAGFHGKDEDVQKLKIVLMNNIEKTVPNVRRTYSIGVHVARVGDEYVNTYVEPGWSMDNYGNEDRYQLSGHIEAAPRIRDEEFPHASTGDPELRTALIALMGINTEIKMAQILGWFCAAFLKQHVFVKHNQFPLMGFGGAAGSGKTALATLVALIHGIDYRGANSTLSLPNATAFALWKTIRDTTTVPRIMEEYNKSKLPRNYIPFGEVFKDCWNQFAVQRGGLSDRKKHGDNQVGAHLMEFPLTAPVLIIAEQQVTMPALVERMIQVPFSKLDLDHTDSEGITARENFGIALKYKEHLSRFAKAANMMALRLSPDDVSEMIASHDNDVPMEMGDRPHFSFKVILAGLDFLSTLANSYNLNLEDHIERLRMSLLAMLQDDISQLAVMKQRTEVDIIMDTLATMAAMSDSTGAVPWLVEHEHYLVDENWLYIDGLVAHAQYRSFCNRQHSIPVIEEYGQFKVLLNTEPYCDSTAMIKDENFARGRTVLRLNLKKMAEKGIEVSAFVAG